jgi:hypothetical protein
MVCCAYRASRWFGGGPASYVEGCATIDNTDPLDSEPRTRQRAPRQAEISGAGRMRTISQTSRNTSSPKACVWQATPQRDGSLIIPFQTPLRPGCLKSAHALSEPGSTFIDASLPAYELVQGFGSWNWHPPLAPGSRNGTRKRFRHLASIPDALSITAQRNGRLQRCGLNLPNDYAHPNPFRLRCRSFCTTLHSKLSHSRSSKCRSCKRITGSSDFTSTATQHRCERGSSTISTLRMIAPHRRRGGIRTKRELGVKPESASGKFFDRKGNISKRAVLGRSRPDSVVLRHRLQSCRSAAHLQSLCPSTPAATSISSLAKSIRTDECQKAAGQAYPPI